MSTDLTFEKYQLISVLASLLVTKTANSHVVPCIAGIGRALVFLPSNKLLEK